MHVNAAKTSTKWRRPGVLSAIFMLVFIAIVEPPPTSAQQADDRAIPPGATSPPTAQEPLHERSPEQIDSMLQILLNDLEQAGRGLRASDERIEQIRQRINSLYEETQTVRRPEKNEQPEEKPEPRRVKFRPPMERLSDKEIRHFVCQGDRISCIDYQQIGTIFKEKTDNGKNKRGGVRFDLPDSDFEVVCHVESDEWRLHVTRKPGHNGETWEEAQRPGAAFQKCLKGTDPEKFVLEFSVWPDSYDLFRKARAAAWQKKYEIDWTPQNAGEPLVLIRGSSVATPQ